MKRTNQGTDNVYTDDSYELEEEVSPKGHYETDITLDNDVIPAGTALQGC